MPDKKINLCLELRQVISICVNHMPVFSHIETGRLAVFLATARKNSKYGVYAKVMGVNEVPDGYQLSHFPNGMLYAIYFYWSRFFDAPFEQKINIVCHELYHISEGFDGKLRRFGTRLHGASREKYEEGYKPQLKTMLMQVEDSFREYSSLVYDSRGLTSQYRVEGDFYTLPSLKPA